VSISSNFLLASIHGRDEGWDSYVFVVGRPQRTDIDYFLLPYEFVIFRHVLQLEICEIDRAS